MATTKVTVTIDNNQLQQIRALVTAGTTPNVSAFVKHAVAVALLDASGWRAMLDEAVEKTGGPLTDDERVWADEVLGTGKGTLPAGSGLGFDLSGYQLPGRLF